MDKVSENRLRRMADRQGYRLVKSRSRDPNAPDYGLYALTSHESGGAVNPAIADRWVCSWTLEEVEEWLELGAQYQELTEELERQADWRAEKAEQHPGDESNAEAARVLSEIAGTASRVPPKVIQAFYALWDDGDIRVSEDWQEQLRQVGFSRHPDSAEELLRDFTAAHTSQPRKATRTSAEARDVLFETIDGLRSGKTSAAEADATAKALKSRVRRAAKRAVRSSRTSE